MPPPSSSGPFQTIWDATRMPQRSWNQALTITSQSALNNWIGNRHDNDHVVVSGFTYNGRLELRGGGPFWMECDPSFKVTNKGKATMPVAIAASKGDRFDEKGVAKADYKDARETLTLAAGETKDVTVHCDFDPDRVVVDPDAVVLQLRRKTATVKL
jgi:hypothetical protein